MTERMYQLSYFNPQKQQLEFMYFSEKEEATADYFGRKFASEGKTCVNLRVVDDRGRYTWIRSYEAPAPAQLQPA
jgi:hypothetical protein